MRFLLGVLVGYTVRGKQKLLIKVLVTLVVVYVVLLAVVFAGNCASGAES